MSEEEKETEKKILEQANENSKKGDRERELGNY
jgi:hypothetical protein